MTLFNWVKTFIKLHNQNPKKYVSDLSYQTEAWDVLIYFKIQYHEKNLGIYLNQSREISEASKRIKATYYLKSHLKWINLVHGNYEVKISDNSNLESVFHVTKDHHNIKMIAK